MLLGEDVFDFASRVDQTHDQVDVAADSSRKYNWLTLLAEIGEEVVQIFTFVYVEQRLVLLKPEVEILLAPRTKHIAFFIRSEGVRDYFVHFQDNSDFGWIGGRWQQFGLVDIFF